MIKKSKKTSETRSDDYPELTQEDFDRAVTRHGLKKKPADKPTEEVRYEIILKLDARGRLTLPLKMRKDFNIEPGDVFFVKPEKTGIHLVKIENPFDILAEHALHEYEQGNCIKIRELASKNKIKVRK
jgi:bifunctional DNA-binding transcriptional regulator/antitoxin component of YhaV-PrlF toxin-antitoxin module